MKKAIFYSIVTLLVMFMSTSCEDGILDQKAVDSFNEESVYMDINLAKAALGKCYDYIGGHNSYGLGLRQWTLSAASDESLCIHGPQQYTFLKGTMTPDYLGAFGNWRFSYVEWVPLYQNIKNLNVFLANIDDVPAKTDVDEELRDRLKAEAYFIRAFDYSNLMRSYGGLVLIDEPFELGEDYLSIQRSSLDETLDFILADCDAAIAGLPEKDGIEQGRATKGAAAALKSRVLSWSTGILMNGGYEASNPLVSFQSGSRTERLQAAKNMAKAIMDGTYGTYALTGTTIDPPSPMTDEDVQAYADNHFYIWNQKGQWNDEIIWGIQYVQEGGNRSQHNKWYGPNGWHSWSNNGPTETAVRQFEMRDGTPFVWDKYDPGNEYFREFTAAELAADPEGNPYVGREPRFYATILYDGARWQDRPSDAAGIDPEGKVQSGYYLVATSGDLFGLDQAALNAAVDTIPMTAGLDTRQSLIEAWNATKTSYCIKKFMDPEIEGQFYNNENTWIEFGMAEVILDYAEACIELGGADLQIGIDALNMIRNRAGLPDRITADPNQAREWLRRERMMELHAGGDRWYMIRKWMIAGDVLVDVHTMKIYHLSDGSMIWNYDVSTVVDDRTWIDRQYWLPIERTEMNKAPQLQQNPGYN